MAFLLQILLFLFPVRRDYIIEVVDANNCSVTLPKVTITAFSKPEYTVTKTDSKCYGEKELFSLM
jgi:hypothetical protein